MTLELRFWPEGRLLHTKENLAHCTSMESLRRAMLQNKVIEGTALYSDSSHNLTVRLGDFTGIIPRERNLARASASFAPSMTIFSGFCPGFAAM